MSNIDEKMKKTIESLKGKLSSVRTGRASPDLLSRVQVNYYGTMTPLPQVASISVADTAMLVVNVFDANAIEDVEKAILSSDLNLNPQTDGSIIRLRLPELTEERRKELLKVIKKEAEDSKISLRNIRRDYLDDVKKEDDSTEDDIKKEHDNAQKVIDTYTHEIDELIATKETEILTI